MNRKTKKILKKLKKWKLSFDQVKAYLTSVGKIVALGEIALRKRERDKKDDLQLTYIYGDL